MKKNGSLLEIREVLVDMKNEGMKKEEMMEYLQKMRACFDEDMILDLMDYVEGFCYPNLSIY